MSDRYGPKRAFWSLKRLFRWQREAPRATPLSQRLKIWRGGYRPVSYTLYDLSPEQASAYLPDTARLQVLPYKVAASTFFINGPFAHGVLNDKLLFSSFLQRHLPVPRILALVERGEVFSRERAGDLLALVRRRGSLVLKPSDGSRGRGVYRLEADPLTLNSRAITPEELGGLVATLDNYLVTETAPQAAYAQAIYPEAANTVRVLTLIDPDSGEPFVARAVHRFGTEATRPTDNWSRGGLSAHVDLATGILGPGVQHAKRTQGVLEWRSHHPDTGAPVEGVCVPRWQEVCEALLETVRTFPFLVYVGWDVVVTETGLCVLEGNKNTDIDLLQVHGGLLGDPRVRRFYQHYGVVGGGR